MRDVEQPIHLARRAVHPPRQFDLPDPRCPQRGIEPELRLAQSRDPHHAHASLQPARLGKIGPLLGIEGKGHFERLRSHGHRLLHRVALRDGFRDVRKRDHKPAGFLVRRKPCGLFHRSPHFNPSAFLITPDGTVLHFLLVVHGNCMLYRSAKFVDKVMTADGKIRRADRTLILRKLAEVQIEVSESGLDKDEAKDPKQ